MTIGLDPSQFVSFIVILKSKMVQQVELTLLLLDKEMFTKVDFLEKPRLFVKDLFPVEI